MRYVRSETGSALVTVVIGVLVFALLSVEMLNAGRAELAQIRARAVRSRLLSAADAGIAIAIHGLYADETTHRRRADGIAREETFDGMKLSIAIDDDQGKIPLNAVSDAVERRMFAAAGIGGSRLDLLVDSLEDWKDLDSSPRRNGAEQSYYTPLGIRARNDAIRTPGELSHLPGMDSALLAKILPAITLFANRLGNFDAEVSSSPLAITAMSVGSSAFDLAKRRAREAGQRPELEFSDSKSLIGRVYTITATARLSGDAQASRTVVVELSGNPSTPYWVRYVY